MRRGDRVAAARHLLFVLLGCVAVAACTPAATMAPAAAPAPAVGTTAMIDTSGRFAKEFDLNEAYSLLELCINANNFGEPGYTWNADDWTPIQPAVAAQKLTGIGPGENAWRLWQKKSAPDTYAVVIRGTIEDSKSILEDIVTTSIASKPAVIKAWRDPGGYISFKLADADGAETHLGFTYGLTVLMFASDAGILKTLKEKVPRGSKLLITGHSQGAAIATLVHAFLHYAINDPGDRYGLRNSGYSLKSYVFAQPKPGNWQFAMDFARIAASRGTAFTINNSRDWVPQVPLALEAFDEPGEDLAKQWNVSTDPALIRGLYDAFKIGLGTLRGSRSAVSRANEKFTEVALQKTNQQPDGMDRKYSTATAPSSPPAGSFNYVAAGNSVPVFGDPPGSPRIVPNDPLYQHHLPTYRTLMHEQLGPANPGGGS